MHPFKEFQPVTPKHQRTRARRDAALGLHSSSRERHCCFVCFGGMLRTGSTLALRHFDDPHSKPRLGAWAAMRGNHMLNLLTVAVEPANLRESAARPQNEWTPIDVAVARESRGSSSDGRSTGSARGARGGGDGASVWPAESAGSADARARHPPAAGERRVAGERLLNEACATLGQRFALLGLVERFEQSMVLWRYTFGVATLAVPLGLHVHGHSGTRRGAANARYGADEMQQVRAAVALDTALYACGVALFERQDRAARASSPELAAALDAAR